MDNHGFCLLESKMIRRKGSHVVIGRMGMKVTETIPEGSNSEDNSDNDIPWNRTQTMAESYTAVHRDKTRFKGKIATPMVGNNTKCHVGEDEGLGESIDQGSDKSENSFTTMKNSYTGDSLVGISHRESEEDQEVTEGDSEVESNAVMPDEITLSPSALPGGVEVHADNEWVSESDQSNPVGTDCNDTELKQGVRKTVSFSTD